MTCTIMAVAGTADEKEEVTAIRVEGVSADEKDEATAIRNAVTAIRNEVTAIRNECAKGAEVDALSPAPHDEEREQQRRLRKRFAALEAIQRSWEFVVLAADARRGGGVSLPEPPDPHTMALSKRRWEAAIQEWRRRLRQECRARGYWEA